MNHRLATLVFLCGLLPIWIGAASGQSPVSSVHWDNVPLGEALVRLSTTIGEPIFTDRRVDPQQQVSLDVVDATSDEVLKQMGEAASLGTSRLGPIAYVGPMESARNLRTLAALRKTDVDDLPANLRASLQRRRPLEWPRLSEPRQLATQLIADRGWKVAGAERIPHDLWAAGSLRELSFAEQMTMLLVGFDLTFALDPQQRVIEIVPLTGPVVIQRWYPMEESEQARALEQSFPQATLRMRGQELVVEATIEEHERLARMLGGEPEPAPASRPRARTRKLYTLRVEQQPVGVVLEQLGRQLGWSIEIDQVALTAAGVSLDQRVSFSVRNVDEDALLKALLRPVDLEFERDGKKLRVFPGRR